MVFSNAIRLLVGLLPCRQNSLIFFYNLKIFFLVKRSCKLRRQNRTADLDSHCLFYREKGLVKISKKEFRLEFSNRGGVCVRLRNKSALGKYGTSEKLIDIHQSDIL